MSAANIDYGQAQIKAFNDAASAGVIQLDPQAVHEAVQLYDQMINGLGKIRDKLRAAKEGKGFGGFPSGQELQAGFSNKAAEGIEVVNQLIDGAMRLQEAYLRAGRLITEADQLNANRIRILGDTPEMGNEAQ
ncbi:hypothetical protein [Nocardia pseudovaccinii]|uniref:hypothetical protein n=1 Tax=Nocardia pseudovaccinii TaxID=189540 RepID=UPI0007A47F22|nr:hypothetical protein [Nocardia pseudovaccinii]